MLTSRRSLTKTSKPEKLCSGNKLQTENINCNKFSMHFFCVRFGVANGFRNIQNVVQKMKRKRCDFDFVEIMACPSGCLNGGAQSRSKEGDVSSLLS